MKATVKQPFDGVLDGEVYPRRLLAGDVIEGDLAVVAVTEQWAEEIKAACTAPRDPVSTEISENWRALNAADTVALASALGAVDIRTKALAVEYIEAEVQRRAAAAAQ